MYFPPKRHELELELISQIVEAVKNSRVAIFIARAAAGKVIGDVSMHIAKKLLDKIIEQFKLESAERKKFKILQADIKKIETFFKTNKKVEINKLENVLGIDKTRLIPILKLLGFKTYQKKNKRYWEKN